MKKLFHLFDRLFFVSVTGWLIIIFFYDLTHPEIWGDWKHNPKWSGPAFVIFVPLFIWVYVFRNTTGGGARGGMPGWSPR